MTELTKSARAAYTHHKAGRSDKWIANFLGTTEEAVLSLIKHARLAAQLPEPKPPLKRKHKKLAYAGKAKGRYND